MPSPIGYETESTLSAPDHALAAEHCPVVVIRHFLQTWLRFMLLKRSPPTLIANKASSESDGRPIVGTGCRDDEVSVCTIGNRRPLHTILPQGI